MKEAKKVKKDLHGLRDAHNERVKEFFSNKGAIDGIAKHIQGQFQITQGLRYAMSAILKKGLITQEEITEFTTSLMEEAKKLQPQGKESETAQEQPESNEAKKPVETSSVQPEGERATEDASGDSDA